MIEGWPFWRHRWPYFLLGLVLVVVALSIAVVLINMTVERLRMMFSGRRQHIA
jgi:hypothetical protein